MSTPHDLGSFDLDLLAEHCANETKKYYRHLANDVRYCFELLCRACRDGSEAALTYLYRIYLPILTTRVGRHALFIQTSQDSASLARTALASFYMAVRGEKFLQKFSTVAQAIAYMYACVHTAVLEDARSNPPTESPSEESIASPITPSETELKELWSHICSLLADSNDQRLAYLRFVLEMKPAEIVQRYPQIWDKPRDVHVALQNIRRHLRADKTLRDLIGLGDNDN